MSVLVLLLLRKNSGIALIFPPENIHTWLLFVKHVDSYINTSKNFKELPYYNYVFFQLDELSDEKCLDEFRFFKKMAFTNLQKKLRVYLLKKWNVNNWVNVDGIEASCIYLKRFAYPFRYSDMMPRFGRNIPQLSIISNLVMNLIYGNHRHCLEYLGQDSFLRLYADSIHAKGTPLNNYCGFIDGTVRPICRPHEMQSSAMGVRGCMSSSFSLW